LYLAVVQFRVDLGNAFGERVGHGPLRPRAELVHAGRVAPTFPVASSQASRITGAVALKSK